MSFLLSIVLAICGIILAVSGAILEDDWLAFVFGMAAAVLASLGGICLTIVELLERGDE